MLISEIISAIEAYASLTLQEPWDNTGLQVGRAQAECTGVLFCLDVTPAIVEEAIALGCNLIVSHHPLFFKPVKRLTGANLVENTAMLAIEAGVAIYSTHTAADSARGGVSYLMAERLGVRPERALEPKEGQPETGLGIVGELAGEGLTQQEFAQRVKHAFGCKMLRATKVDLDAAAKIKRVALCGGAGGDMIDLAIAAGAQAYVTADVRYHDFVDYRDRILLIDAGHYETEAPIKERLRQEVEARCPGVKTYCTKTEDNPINYL